MKTKFFLRFTHRITLLDVNLEFADIASKAATQGTLTTPDAPYIFDLINPDQHPRLAARPNTAAAKNLAITQFKTAIYGSYIKDAYEEFSLYIQAALRAVALSGLIPHQLMGEQKIQLEANDILAAGNWAKTIDLITKNIYRELEQEKSAKELIQKFSNKLGLAIQPEMLEAIVPFFDIRGLFAYSDGKADATFVEKYPEFGASAGSLVAFDLVQLQAAREALVQLVTEIDQQIIEKSILQAPHLQA